MDGAAAPASSAGCGAQRPGCASYYRRDGVRRTTSVGLEVELAAKYGEPGRTDDEGFDPYADTVGPGIYSGCVQVSRPLARPLLQPAWQTHTTACTTPLLATAGLVFTPRTTLLQRRFESDADTVA